MSHYMMGNNENKPKILADQIKTSAFTQKPVHV